jgi:predicted nuclease of predicted toxin-antitoxin system
MPTESDNDDWFEISDELWLDPKSHPKKLKLCADANIPQFVVDELRGAGIPVITAQDDNIETREDKSILAWAKKSQRVLLTLDRDFWDDHKFPMHDVPGVIFVDAPSNNTDSILQAFGLIYGTFASSYSLDWWQNMKARATTSRYFLKTRNWEGRIAKYEIKLKGGKLLARELS